MTEQERIDREALLKRAAAAAGALYVAPVLTSTTGAETGTPCRGRCKAGAGGEAKCQSKGGTDCHCSVAPGKKWGRCRVSKFGCGQDERCGPQEACEAPRFCSGNQACVCLVVANGGGQTECVDFPARSCEDYPPCDKSTGLGCPPGMCCLDSCCPTGICSPPCFRESEGATTARRSGTGPTLTL